MLIIEVNNVAYPSSHFIFRLFLSNLAWAKLASPLRRKTPATVSFRLGYSHWALVFGYGQNSFQVDNANILVLAQKRVLCGECTKVALYTESFAWQLNFVAN
jgi:hypothetical protein